jgi:simple sugar transport system permease protein
LSAIAPETNVGLLAQPALREAANGLGRTVLALVLALVAGAVLIVLAGENPVTAYGALVDGALGGVPAIARTLRLAAPLIITGLAVTVAFRAGFIYLGVEGSLYVGALAAAVSGIYLAPHLPGLLLLPAALAAAALGGGAWAAIPAWLRTRWRVDEIVSTLMLNYVAVLLVDQLVFAYLQDPAAGSNSDRALTVAVPSAARLPFLMQRYGLTVAIFFAVALVALFAWIYRARVWGYEADMTGYNRRFARHGGIDVMRIGFVSMAAGGALAGFAGATEILGSYGRYAGGFAGDLGFDCITVALMGRLSPVGTMLAALFLGALKNGGASMELAVNLPRDLVVVLQGLILLMVTAQGLFSLVWRGWRPRGRA